MEPGVGLQITGPGKYTIKHFNQTGGKKGIVVDGATETSIDDAKIKGADAGIELHNTDKSSLDNIDLDLNRPAPRQVTQ